MLFEAVDNNSFDPDNDGCLGMLRDQYKLLSKEEQELFMERLNGPKDRAIDPSKLKWFLNKVGLIKSFMKECTSEFKLDIDINNSKNAVVKVILLELDLKDVGRLRKICDGCKFFEITMTNDGYLRISFSYDIIIKVGGSLL